MYLLGSKDETLEKFKIWKAIVETATGKKVKNLRTDNGGEYMGHSFTNKLKEFGVEHQTTVPYTPQ